MKLPVYSEPMDWEVAINELVSSLFWDYSPVDERIGIEFDVKVDADAKDDVDVFRMKTSDEYLGVVFYQTDLAGKKYKFTITREAA